MKLWPLQDAKNQFSEVVRRAQKEGPQTVTRHGRPVAVVVAAEEFRNAQGGSESVLEFFAPLKGSGINLNGEKIFRGAISSDVPFKSLDVKMQRSP